MALSQAQVIGRPPMKTWDDYEAGCLASFGGGHKDQLMLAAFHHGMSTVFNLLRAEFPPADICKAAPDLLEALRECITETGAPAARGHREAIRRIDAINAIACAAIAKATS